MKGYAAFEDCAVETILTHISPMPQLVDREVPAVNGHPIAGDSQAMHMNTTLYRIHCWQARKRDQEPLPYDEFQERLPACPESDLTCLLLPPAHPRPPVEERLLFTLGTLTITPQASEHIAGEDIARGLQRHLAGDWGAVSRETWEENDLAVVIGEPIRSRYETEEGKAFYIRTSRCGFRTTVMTCDEDPDF